MRLSALVIILLIVPSACEVSENAGVERLRIATFNIAMGLEEAGQMRQALEGGEDPRLRNVARILREVRPDIVLLNEFDYDPSIDAAALFNANYLLAADSGQESLQYPHHFRAPVNTGIDSGLDLDGDGSSGGPGDAWGFGRFPGQYGMLVLSRYPLWPGHTRSFRQLRWSDMPGALRPRNLDGSPFHPDETWEAMRLSSKSHWDLAFDIGGARLHLLAHHPTPPVFDGPEDRNGRRNHDEIRFWADYTQPGGAMYIVDDEGRSGGLADREPFVIAGDFNADRKDGDSVPGAIGQLLDADWIEGECVPLSTGGVQASLVQGGVNRDHQEDASADTADFNDEFTGNLRLDYLLPSRDLEIIGCGVFWPASGEAGQEWIDTSDHRLVWLDIAL